MVDAGELGMNGGFWARRTGADLSPVGARVCLFQSCLGLSIPVSVTDPWLEMPPCAMGANTAGLAPEGQSI